MSLPIINDIDSDIAFRIHLAALFSVFIRTFNIRTIMWEDNRNRSAGLFLGHDKNDQPFGGSIDHIPLYKPGTDVQVGHFAYTNGTISYCEINAMILPIQEWEEEYLREYNKKHNINLKKA